MPRPIVLDTTAMIAMVREPGRALDIARAMATGTVWLPAVVAAEIFCGTRTVEQSRLAQRLYDLFDQHGRVLTSTADEYVRAGKLIRRAIDRTGAMEPRDHLNDVLIALIAHRLGARIATENRADFDSWIALGSLSADLLSQP